MNPSTFWMISAKESLKRHRFRRRNRDDERGDPTEGSPQHVGRQNERTTPLKSVRVFSVSILFTLLSGFAVPGFADDLEIYSDAYYGGDAGTFKPNILFMLDNS